MNLTPIFTVFINIIYKPMYNEEVKSHTVTRLYFNKGRFYMNTKNTQMFSYVLFDPKQDKQDLIYHSLKLLHHNQNLVIHSFHCIEQFVDSFSQIQEPSIFLLDMYDKEETLNIYEQIHQNFPNSAIIYISDTIESVLDILETEFCYFIYFPQLEEALTPALKKAYHYISKYNNKLVIHMKDKSVFIPEQEIDYLERVKRTTYIYAAETYHDSRNLEILLSQLNLHFVQCHRSFAVNLDKVKEYYRDKFILQSGQVIPISRPYTKEIKTFIHQYMEEL